MQDPPDALDAAVLVPVKGFAAAKARLAAALGADERAALARRMAEVVVAAAAPLPVAVACDDEGVAEWAEGVGARVIWTPGKGLNGAVQQGFAVLASEVALVVVAHGDLPHARRLDRVVGAAGVTLVPDRHDDGTNVLVVPATAAGFTFAYGPGSFARHRSEAGRLGLATTVLRLPDLQWDVDQPSDLPEPASPLPAST